MIAWTPLIDAKLVIVRRALLGVDRRPGAGESSRMIGAAGWNRAASLSSSLIAVFEFRRHSPSGLVVCDVSLCVVVNRLRFALMQHRHSLSVLLLLLLLLLGRLFWVDLIKWVSDVRPSVRTYVRPSVHKQFLRFQWHPACRSMSDARQYAVWPDPRSRSRSQGHEPLKVVNPYIFKSYLLRHLQWELATDYWFLN